MTGPSDAQPPAGQRTPPKPAARSSAKARPLLGWLLIPALLGSITGVLVVVTPWGQSVLALVLVISGLAWLLRVAGDWIVERAGPTRGVVLIGAVLIGTWLVMAVNQVGSLRGTGLGRLTREPKDPYALPPSGPPVSPNLKDPDEPIDPVQPLKDLVTPSPSYEPPAPPTPPADGRRGDPRVTLRLSSSQSAFGEGLVLIAEVAGDGRPVHGTVTFFADGKEVAARTLRVQGTASQIEYRLAGLPVGLHTLQARYQGSRTFRATDSADVAHRVVAR